MVSHHGTQDVGVTGSMDVPMTMSSSMMTVSTSVSMSLLLIERFGEVVTTSLGLVAEAVVVPA